MIINLKMRKSAMISLLLASLDSVNQALNKSIRSF